LLIGVSQQLQIFRVNFGFLNPIPIYQENSGGFGYWLINSVAISSDKKTYFAMKEDALWNIHRDE